jgi:hypothetical protein
MSLPARAEFFGSAHMIRAQSGETGLKTDVTYFLDQAGVLLQT